MNNVVDTWLGFISGVFGFGVSSTMLRIGIPADLRQLFWAGLIATFSGICGIVGKNAGSWMLRRYRLWINKTKK
ncbi:MAG: hypothetical protein Q8932_19950 [Bacteroidota bacterium]|nr:hypothetical protein [Bacteroidota bacterium]